MEFFNNTCKVFNALYCKFRLVWLCLVFADSVTLVFADSVTYHINVKKLQVGASITRFLKINWFFIAFCKLMALLSTSESKTVQVITKCTETFKQLSACILIYTLAILKIYREFICLRTLFLCLYWCNHHIKTHNGESRGQERAKWIAKIKMEANYYVSSKCLHHNHSDYLLSRVNF